MRRRAGARGRRKLTHPPLSRRAASQFRLNGVDVVLAKVDGPSEPRLMRELEVHGFPSFHWFAYGRLRDYGGGRRNDSMVEWVTYHARKNAFHEVSSTREAEDLIASLNATEAVVGRFVSRWSPEATSFMIGAEEEDTRSQNKSMAYILILEDRGIGALKLGSQAGEELESGQLQGPAIGPSVYLMRSEDAGGGYVHYGRQYKPPKWDRVPPDQRYSLFDPGRLKAWVATFRMPKVVPLTRYWNKVLASPVRNQTLLFSDEGSPGHQERMAAFSMVAERWFGKVLFLEIPSKLTNVLKYFGMTADDYPALVVAVAGNGELDKGEMYRLDQTNPEYNFTTILRRSASRPAGEDTCRQGQTCAGEMQAVAEMERVIRSFAISSFEGKEMEFKLPEQDLTEDVIYPDDPVRKLTASNFLDVVLDAERDVFVKFYAPWCGHCKSMKTSYMELCDKFEDRPKVVVAEFDATAHKVPPVVAGSPLSVEGYPTLILWPAELRYTNANRPLLPSKYVSFDTLAYPSNSTQNKASPIRYQGAREVEAMEAFIRKHSVSLQIVNAMENKVAALEVRACSSAFLFWRVRACLRCRQVRGSSDKAKALRSLGPTPRCVCSR